MGWTNFFNLLFSRSLSLGMRIDFEKEPDHQEMSKVLIKLSVNKFSQGVC